MDGLINKSPAISLSNKCLFLDGLNLETVKTPKQEPYIYWGLAVIFTTHRLHIQKKMT